MSSVWLFKRLEVGVREVQEMIYRNWELDLSELSPPLLPNACLRLTLSIKFVDSIMLAGIGKLISFLQSPYKNEVKAKKLTSFPLRAINSFPISRNGDLCTLRNVLVVPISQRDRSSWIKDSINARSVGSRKCLRDCSRRTFLYLPSQLDRRELILEGEK